MIVAIKLKPREDRSRGHGGTVAMGLGSRTWEAGHPLAPRAKAVVAKGQVGPGNSPLNTLPSSYRFSSLKAGAGALESWLQISKPFLPALLCN